MTIAKRLVMLACSTAAASGGGVGLFESMHAPVGVGMALGLLALTWMAARDVCAIWRRAEEEATP